MPLKNKVIGCVQHDCPECQAREAEKLMKQMIREEITRMRLDIQQLAGLVDANPKDPQLKKNLLELRAQYDNFCTLNCVTS